MEELEKLVRGEKRLKAAISDDRKSEFLADGGSNEQNTGALLDKDRLHSAPPINNGGFT